MFSLPTHFLTYSPDCLNGHRSETTIHIDRFACYEAAGDGREQEQGCADQLGCLAEATHRGVAEDRVDSRLIENLAVLLCGKKSWAKAIYADAVRGKLAGDVLRQTKYAGLGGRVSEHARQRPEACNAADVEDRTAP